MCLAWSATLSSPWDSQIVLFNTSNTNIGLRQRVRMRN